MRTIKIPEKEYKLLKAIAKDRGCFLTKVLAEAVRIYAGEPAQLKEKP